MLPPALPVQVTPAPGSTWRITYTCPNPVPYPAIEALDAGLVLDTNGVANLTSYLIPGTTVIQGNFSLSLDGESWCVPCVARTRAPGLGGGGGRSSGRRVVV